MALPAVLQLPTDPLLHVGLVAVGLVVILSIVFYLAQAAGKKSQEEPTLLEIYWKFCWNCFVKPHSGDGSRNQQDALESFYQAQAGIYDATRGKLLKGREEMLGLVAAQMKARVEAGAFGRKPVWVDVGGGTGYNIEHMAKYLPVADFFDTVYLVDLSPSLCNVARKRFARLGWKNVKVLCEDARTFRLVDHSDSHSSSSPSKGQYTSRNGNTESEMADLITLSFSLSMIPEFYPVIDTLSSRLSPNGIVGVADFYVQNEIDYQCRNYTGGAFNRHCMWISRVFWRTWFEADRVNLEAARRDYLEYRFGTILSINERNHFLGVRIPYYIWVGTGKESGTTASQLAELDAAVTESPFLSALDLQRKSPQHSRSSSSTSLRSKAYESAVVNLAASLPLPASWYQSHHWRIYYDDQLPKHRQFNDSYIYAFTWEDARVDARLLKIKPDDVILAITSAGDNALSYVLEGAKRVHAVDLNPTQNHLLELKVAAFTALGYSDVWKLFGEGKHEAFQDLLINKLSPHMSAHAVQYWFAQGPSTFTKNGLYYTGGSRHAIKLVRLMFQVLGLSGEVKRLCAAQTLAEQREIWQKSIRKVLLSRVLSWAVIGNERWLWKALGVPPAQRDMIEQDYIRQEDAHSTTTSNSNKDAHVSATRSGHAIWEYVVNTLDPVVHSTLISDDNHYYLLCLQGRYSRRCHPAYLTPKAHIKLSHPDAFNGLRIHTDEINEVVSRMTPGTLTIAVVMDSMDWFTPGGAECDTQVKALNRALKMGGRVLLRSAGLVPWYVRRFEELGFVAKRVGARVPGSCIDRVNMYASTWILTKAVDLEMGTSMGSRQVRSPKSGGVTNGASLEHLDLGRAAME